MQVIYLPLLMLAEKGILYNLQFIDYIYIYYRLGLQKQASDYSATLGSKCGGKQFVKYSKCIRGRCSDVSLRLHQGLAIITNGLSPEVYRLYGMCMCRHTSVRILYLHGTYHYKVYMLYMHRIHRIQLYHIIRVCMAYLYRKKNFAYLLLAWSQTCVCL